MTQQEEVDLCRRVGRLVKAYLDRHTDRGFGQDLDDCVNDAWLILHNLKPEQYKLPADELVKLLLVITRRHVVRNAVRVRDRSANFGNYAAPTDRSQELLGLVEDAIGEVKDFLQTRVIDGLSWGQAKALHGWNDREQATIRMRTADWLLAQYEGGAS